MAFRLQIIVADERSCRFKKDTGSQPEASHPSWAGDPSMRDHLETPRDQSLNRPLKNLEGAKVEDRPINRLLKIHEAAKLELQDLKADFQIRLQESILQTEENLKQRFAD